MNVSLYITAKTLAKSILQQIFVIPAAALYYRLRLRKKGVYNLVICDHIGDFLFTMGYARAFVRKNHIKNLRIAGTARFRELAGLYPLKNSTYRTISPQWLHILCISQRYAAGRRLFGMWDDHCIVEPAAGFSEGFSYAGQFPQMNLKLCVCCGCLRLRPDSQFDTPALQQAAWPRNKTMRCAHAARYQKQKEYKKQKEQNKTDKLYRKGKILLCPFAQAIHYDGTKELFWRLAGRLRKENYLVYVNAAGGQNWNTKAANIPSGLAEFYKNLGEYDTVIGIRSGILDLAAFSGCRVIALYPPDYELTAFYTLHSTNEAKKDVYEYSLTGDMETDVQAVMRMNEKKAGKEKI